MVDELLGTRENGGVTMGHAGIFPSPIAVGLRVANVRRAAGFYQQIGFTFVMAVPDEHDEWLLCLLRYGSGSILLGALDHPQLPLSRRHAHARRRSRGLGGRIDLTVPDVAATYSACLEAGCKITEQPVQEFWGDRTFSCRDPFGYEWRFTQKAEQVALGRAANAMWS
jgi:uncharacterized glyoxalase superfamily protein PhnB